jgi:hypothetical protein
MAGDNIRRVAAIGTGTFLFFWTSCLLHESSPVTWAPAATSNCLPAP